MPTRAKQDTAPRQDIETKEDLDKRLLQLVETLETGNQTERNEAETELIDLCAHEVCASFDKKMSQDLQSKFDGDDVVNTTFRSLFGHIAKREYRFEHAGSLWAMIYKIARNKFLKLVEINRAGQRTAKRETIANTSQVTADLRIDRHRLDRVARDWADHIEPLLEKVDATHAEWFRLRHQEGWSLSAIAAKAGCSRRHVTTTLEKLVERFSREVQAASGEAA